MLDLAGEGLARVAGADDDHAFPAPAGVVGARKRSRPTRTIDARAEEGQQREGPVDEQHAAGRLRRSASLMPNELPTYQAAMRSVSAVVRPATRRIDVRDAHVAPPAAIEPEERADDELRQHDDRKARREQLVDFPRDRELEPDEPRERVARREDERVEEEEQDDPRRAEATERTSRVTSDHPLRGYDS